MVAAFPTREIRTVAVLYNPRRPDAVPPGEPPDRIAEYDAPGTAAAVADALAAAGYRPVVLEVDERLPCRLAAERPDAAFNLAEGLRGTSREAQVPALLEMLGIPYTGSGVDSLVLCQDKQLAKEVLAAHGVDSPRGVAVPPGDVARALDVAARCGYPLMVKPVAEGSSMGVDGDACARDQDELLTAVARIHLLYRQPALVEEFLPGREFTVGIVGNRPPRALPVREVAFDAVPHPHGGVYSYRFKQAWDDPSYFLCPAPLTPAATAEVQRLALQAFRALRCRDVARVDIRCDATGRPRVLEVNPLPGLAPGYSDLVCAAEVAGWSHRDLVLAVWRAAVERWQAGAAPP